MHLTLKYHEIWWMTVLDQSYDLCKVDPGKKKNII